jgi:hypothetical protein
MSELIDATSQELYSFSSKIGTAMPLYSRWKGKTFQQIVSSIQKNATQPNTNIGQNMFRAQPLKIYRKEIANAPLANPSVPRTGISIDEMSRPGGTILVKSYHTPTPVGLDGFVLESNETGNTMDHYGAVYNNSICQSPALCAEINARRRCRSSGRMKNTYNSTAGQYLASRNMTFQQNQFNFLLSGNNTVDAGSPLAQKNVYGAQGPQFGQIIYEASGVLSTCSKMPRPYTTVIYKPNNYKFAMQGAADSGALTLRRKFDTITNNTALYKKIYGNSVASAMGYGIADTVYTDKGKIGYPLPKTPKFSLYSSKPQCCKKTSISG